MPCNCPPPPSVTSSAGTGVSPQCSPQSSCNPACPTPVTIGTDTRSPHLPAWLALLTQSTFGRLLVSTAEGIFKFASSRSGVLWWNAESQSAQVRDFPFLRNEPQATSWGRLAKVTPQTESYLDDEGVCRQRVVMGLASQDMSVVEQGDLAVVNFPLPGDLPADQAADPGSQARIDSLRADYMADDALFSPESGLLTCIPKRVTVGRVEVIKRIWRIMKQLVFRRSTFGSRFQLTSSDYLTGVPVYAVVVPGGTSDNPLIALRLPETRPKTLPETGTEGDQLIFRSGQWVAGQPTGSRGLSFYPQDPTTIFNRTTGGSATVSMPDFNESAEEVWAHMLVSISAGSGSAGSTVLKINGANVCSIYAQATANSMTVHCFAKVTQSSTFLLEGSATQRTCNVSLLGYSY